MSRRVADPPHIAREKRLNPQVLRKIIVHLINRFFDGKKNRVYTTLRTHQERKQGRPEQTIIGKEKLDGILKDRSAIEYQQLEGFAHAAQVPTFLLLAFSRAHADQMDIYAAERIARNATAEDVEKIRERAAEAKKNRARMALFASQLSELIENHTDEIDDVDQWIDMYIDPNPSFDLEQH